MICIPMTAPTTESRSARIRVSGSRALGCPASFVEEEVGSAGIDWRKLSPSELAPNEAL
jgi:hypothetical protein